MNGEVNPAGNVLLSGVEFSEEYQGVLEMIEPQKMLELFEPKEVGGKMGWYAGEARFTALRILPHMRSSLVEQVPMIVATTV